MTSQWHWQLELLVAAKDFARVPSCIIGGGRSEWGLRMASAMVIAALLLVSTLGFSTAQSMASAPALSIANATAPAPASSPTAQTSASAPTQSPGLTNLNSAVKFTFNVSAIQKDGSWVNVSWSGVPNATVADVIVLYVPASADITQLVPAKYKWANQSPGYLSGSGSLVFHVLNQRSDAIFYYFYNQVIDVNGTVDPEENNPPNGFVPGQVIGAQVLKVNNTNYPTQGHLAFTKNQGEILVQWTTADAGSPKVKVGTASKAYTITATGNSSLGYSRAEMCGAPANTTGYFSPGTFNRALLTGLQPNTKYYYVYGDDSFGYSDEFSFTTPPSVGPDATVHFIAWADSGQATDDGSDEWEWSDYDPVVTTPSNTTFERLAQIVDVWQQDQAQQGASLQLTNRIAQELSNVTLLIHNGDISYARGSVTQWDVFFDQYKTLLAAAPYMVLPGNHERDWPMTGDRYWPRQNAQDSGGECGVAYERRLTMPQPGVDKQWYSFDYGPIHFLQFSTEHPFGPGSEQYIFIYQDLAAVNRTKTPWVVVGMHRPIYTSSIYGHKFGSDVHVADDLQKDLEEIFFLFEVDMTWSGHVHMYERTCPVLKKSCLGYNATDGTALGPVHICTGNGGFEFTWFMDPSPPKYWAMVALEHGYMRIDANSTYFHVQEVSSETGRIIDDFTLVKPFGWKPKGASNRQAFMDYFISNYTTTNWWESPGVSSDALWGTPLYIPAADIIQADPSLIDSVQGAELVNSINAPDTVFNLAQIFQLYYKVFNSTKFFNATSEPDVARTYLNGIMNPLLEFFFTNAAAQANGKDGGIVRAQTDAGTPGAGSVAYKDAAP